MESLCLWVVTAPPNYSPLPWVVSLFQQVWNIALELIIPQPTLGLAWRIAQFLRSAPVQTGKRTRAPDFTMCSLRAGNTDLLGSISGMFIALLSCQQGRGHSLCRPRAQSPQCPPGLCKPNLFTDFFNCNPVSRISGTVICSTAETMGEYISVQGMSFLYPPTFST